MGLLKHNFLPVHCNKRSFPCAALTLTSLRPTAGSSLLLQAGSVYVTSFLGTFHCTRSGSRIPRSARGVTMFSTLCVSRLYWQQCRLLSFATRKVISGGTIASPLQMPHSTLLARNVRQFVLCAYKCNVKLYTSTKPTALRRRLAFQQRLQNEYNNPSFATMFQRALLNTCITTWTASVV
jgi:hypothetical protein